MSEDIVLQIEGFLDKIFTKKKEDKQASELKGYDAEAYKKMRRDVARLRDEISHIESSEDLQIFKEEDVEDFKDDWITHAEKNIAALAQKEYDRIIDIINKKYKDLD